MTESQTPVSLPVVVEVKSYGFIIRALYFIFIGWWLGLAWSLLSWLVYATVILAPVGAHMMNRVPGLISLKARQKEIRVETGADGTTVKQESLQQHNLLLRIIYYPFGLIFSLITILAAWLLCCLIITMPLGIWLYGKVPWIASLHRGSRTGSSQALLVQWLNQLLPGARPGAYNTGGENPAVLVVRVRGGFR